MAESRTNFDFPAQLPIRSECADYDGFLASPRYSAVDAMTDERNSTGFDDVARNTSFNGKNRYLLVVGFGRNCMSRVAVHRINGTYRTYLTYGAYATSDIILRLRKRLIALNLYQDR